MSKLNTKTKLRTRCFITNRNRNPFKMILYELRSQLSQAFKTRPSRPTRPSLYVTNLGNIISLRSYTKIVLFLSDGEYDIDPYSYSYQNTGNTIFPYLKILHLHRVKLDSNVLSESQTTATNLTVVHFPWTNPTVRQPVMAQKPQDTWETPCMEKNNAYFTGHW